MGAYAVLVDDLLAVERIAQRVQRIAVAVGMQAELHKLLCLTGALRATAQQRYEDKVLEDDRAAGYSLAEH
jgi:hypothetical protein